MNTDIAKYHAQQNAGDMDICEKLFSTINSVLNEDESKLWHGHPVWFIEGNPIVGYSKEKSGIRLMFWSGADFEEEQLSVRGAKFKDASIFYNQLAEVKVTDLKRWLKKSKTIQWDYKNIVKRKGKLEKLS